MTSAFRLAAALCVAACALGSAPAPVKLVSNRAIYDVSLERTSPGSVVAVRGRTAIDFRDQCDKWKTAQRFVADMTDGDGAVSRNDFYVVATEAKDGHGMQFTIKNTVDGQVAEDHTGTATMAASGGEVVLLGKTKTHFQLPQGTVFPTVHSVDIINAARAGQTSLKRTVFQGGDQSDLYYAVATIGKPVTVSADVAGLDKKSAALVKGVTEWPVLVSYYSKDAIAPDYEIDSRLYANGVIGSMSLIYSRFTLRAKLVKLEALPSSCP